MLSFHQKYNPNTKIVFVVSNLWAHFVNVHWYFSVATLFVNGACTEHFQVRTDSLTEKDASSDDRVPFMMIRVCNVPSEYIHEVFVRYFELMIRSRSSVYYILPSQFFGSNILPIFKLGIFLYYTIYLFTYFSFISLIIILLSIISGTLSMSFPSSHLHPYQPAFQLLRSFYSYRL